MQQKGNAKKNEKIKPFFFKIEFPLTPTKAKLTKLTKNH